MRPGGRHVNRAGRKLGTTLQRSPGLEAGERAMGGGCVEDPSAPHWSPGLEAGDTARNAVRAMARAKLQ